MHIDVRVSRLGDPPLFPELENKFSAEGSLESVGILQGGMEGGATSLGLNILLPDGSYVWVQTSAKLLRMLATILNAAECSFADEENKI